MAKTLKFPKCREISVKTYPRLHLHGGEPRKSVSIPEKCGKLMYSKLKFLGSLPAPAQSLTGSIGCQLLFLSLLVFTTSSKMTQASNCHPVAGHISSWQTAAICRLKRHIQLSFVPHIWMSWVSQTKLPLVLGWLGRQLNTKQME